MDKYNEWTKISEISKGKWKVSCSCGKVEIRYKSVIINGYSKSCLKCSYELRKSAISASMTVHGKSNCPTQTSYMEMKRRCYSKHRAEYKNYGARGIKVCDRWLNGEDGLTGYNCFLIDMGERIKEQTLERIDVNGDYEPKNCKWDSMKAQSNNKRNTPKFKFNNEVMPLSYIADKVGVNRGTLYNRIFIYGLSFDQAISKPLRKTKPT